MTRRLLMTVLSASVALAVVSAGTWAWFQSSVASVGNAFSTGTLLLGIADQDEPPEPLDYGTAVSETWTAEGMYPGQSLGLWVGHGVRIYKAGTLDGSSVEIALSNAVDDPVGADMDKYMEITRMVYTNGGTVELLPLIEKDDPSVPYVSLHDLEQHPVRGLHPPAGVAYIQLALRFHESAPNSTQGRTLTSRFDFTLHQ
jgi:predicted ribosomally synthesized peptide with SipW-like signal peptide